jgi:Ca-activated chloride channel family protein
MVKRFNIGLFALLFFALSVVSSYAQPQQPTHLTRVLFLFDASLSMSDKWDKTPKIDIAKRVLIELVDSLRTFPNLQMGLRTFGADYGLYPNRNCEDTRLVVPFSDNNSKKINEAIKGITPHGTTPIAYSLGQCANDFTKCSNCRNLIILITDGIEECDGNPCDVSKELQKKGIILKPFIIGIGKEDFQNAYSCVGKFFDVKAEDDLSNTMKIIISQALNNTSVQVNLLDENGKATETDAPLTFYDEVSGKIVTNMMHTINDAGNPDTIELDPNYTYHLTVHTLPEVEKSGITVTPGKHNIVAVKAPQGYLHIVMDGNNDYKSLVAIVRKNEDMKTLNVQTVESTEKYLIGKYDLEILTLPRMSVSGVKITQSTTTTVTIPQAGEVTLFKPGPGPGQILLDDNGKMVWVCNVDNNVVQTTIVLQPGLYHIVYRPQNVHQTIYTVDKSFEIKSGSSAVVRLE